VTHDLRASPGLATLALLGLAATAQATGLKTYTDEATFLAETGAASASGPLPDLGIVPVSATVGSLTFSVAPGGDNLSIGTVGTILEPDEWCPMLPGNDIAQGFENLQVDSDTPVYSLGLQIVQPDATMPVWGGTPVDSTFEISLYDGATLVGQAQFSGIPVDVVTFLGVWSSAPFSTVTIIDVTDSPFVDDDEFYGEIYTAPGPHAWNNRGYPLTGSYGDPLLFGTGPLTAGSDGWLVLVNTVPSELAVLFLSLGGSPTPFKGGMLVPVPVLTTLPFFTDPIGQVPLGWLAWPSGLSGLSVDFQYGMQDVAAVKGIALSNALRADVP